MPRSWKVYDDWEAGGFFAGGSFDAAERFTSVNMQRYQNGSLGPRPGWRKQTMTPGTAQTAISAANANKARLQYGFGWHAQVSVARRADGHTVGAFLHVCPFNGGAYSRTYLPTPGSDVTKLWAQEDLAYIAAIASDIVPEAYQVNDLRPVNGSGSGVADIGAILYNATVDTKAYVTPGTGVLSGYRPHLVFYRGRLYGFQSGVNMVITDSANLTQLNTGDAAAFTFAGAVSGATPFVPKGAWPLPNGLLVYCAASVASSGPNDYSTPYTPNRGTEIGRWFLLTGTSPSNGALTPLGDVDVGPLFYALSIIHDNKVLFPIYQRGWAVHDGTKLDTSSLSDLRPGRGQFATGSLWYNPVRTTIKSSLILPFYTSGVDPTASGAGTTDRIGEFYNTGHGAYEFINGAWTESLYLHGQGDIVGYSNFENDKLAVMHLDSSDAGANWFPVIWTRDTTLDRPATSSSQNTYNPASSSTETAPTQAGGATGEMVLQLTTGETVISGFGSTTVEAVVIDYDYWNSSLFTADCGFDVSIIYRSGSNLEKQEVQVNTQRITPPGTSLEHHSKRARASLNLAGRIQAGSFQVKVHNIIGCAFHSIAVAHVPDPVVR